MTPSDLLFMSFLCWPSNGALLHHESHIARLASPTHHHLPGITVVLYPFLLYARRCDVISWGNIPDMLHPNAFTASSSPTEASRKPFQPFNHLKAIEVPHILTNA